MRGGRKEGRKGRRESDLIQVYRGWGDKIQSQCGTIFSECAIKTVSEDANPAERLHFLIG